jgi:hypothetical protein
MHTLDNQNTQDATLRPKLHRLLTENFELKEIVTRIENTLHTID